MVPLNKRLSEFILFIFLLSVTPVGFAHGQSASQNPNSGPTVTFSCPPGDYGMTPAGCVPVECGFGNVHTFDAKTGKITFNDGRQITDPPKCLTGAPVLVETRVYPDGRIATRTFHTLHPIGPDSDRRPDPYPTNGCPGNCVEALAYSNCFFLSCSQLSYFSANWQVPSVNPTTNDGQDIYLFNALTDYYNSQLIQPVLLWGTTYCGPRAGGNYWWVADFFVTGSTCTMSGPSGPINNNDALRGFMGTVPGGYGATICDNTAGWCIGFPNTTNTMNNAYVELEAGGIKHCTDYPNPGPVTTSFTNVQMNGGTPGWQNQGPYGTDCTGYAVSASGTNAYLQYY
jgi:hypothetical protein